MPGTGRGSPGQAGGTVTRTHEPGRREVWYELTEKGRDLAPVLEALVAWGLEHERHALAADEAAHPEHLVAGLRVALDRAEAKPPRARTWRFEFDDPEASFVLAFDGERWSLVEAVDEPDVVVRTTPRAWADFVTRPPARRRLPSREIRLSGERRRVAELVATFGAAPAEL